MLKSLELSGFKSFADRTRMDFPRGISALVGPNGSGKSNIVDSIKWVLGEQSVKKLRGGEMTDVIFNGSESRGASNCAEVTLTFDNTGHYLQLDTPQVAITRRVYRSGESEYLVNRQPSRLKDIRELLSGTGLGLQAYSIIEQGRVELLLQSTGAQRRNVLEEAAGIARFNAKKQETARRLEKVEANLLRLRDIVTDLDSQLRATKAQAGKAQQYRQYTGRLEELRTRLGVNQWRVRQESIKRLATEINSLDSACNDAEEQIRQAEAELTQENAQLETVEENLRAVTQVITSLREKIASYESTSELQFAQLDPLEEEIAVHGRELLALSLRHGDTDEQMRKIENDIFQARREQRKANEEYEKSRERQELLDRKSRELNQQLDLLKEAIQKENLSRTRIEGEIAGLLRQKATYQGTKDRKEADLTELRNQLNDIAKNDQELLGSSELLDAQNKNKEEEIARLRKKEEELADTRQRKTQDHELKTRKLSGMNERISLLEDLLRKRDGLGPGVRDILTKATDPTGPFRHVHGLVADLIRVNVEAAHLIELALGADAEHVVVSPDPEFFRYIEENEHSFAGQVSFIWPEPHPREEQRLAPGVYDGVAGVLGRADRFVETDPQYETLVWRLLGRTWIVESLAVAKRLYRHSDGRTNFVTLQGQALNANGTFFVGPAQSSGGWVTRRSELRQLLEERKELQELLEQEKSELKTSQEEILSIANARKRLQEELTEDKKKLDTLRLDLVTNKRQRSGLNRQLNRLNSEIEDANTQLVQIEDGLTEANQRLKMIQFTSAVNDAKIQKLNRKTERTSDRLAFETEETSRLQIMFTQRESRLNFLTESQKQFEQNRVERQGLLAQHRAKYYELIEKLNATRLMVLQAESALAELYSTKEFRLQEQSEIRKEREAILDSKKETEREIRSVQGNLSKGRERVGLLKGEVTRYTQDCALLEERLKEDYGLNIGEAAEKNNDPPLAPEEEEAGQKEINELKGKLKKLGNVNLEAIRTLEKLEERYNGIARQYEDLITARKAIQKIVERINTDSQKLFDETFDAVKIYFNDIFQRLFGGGHADLVFEDPNSTMDSGIDIIVRPPGKDLKSIMLLSGGEKTLTCVAFLLAIFRYRAGPVCILDEVDAALDEGNVGRFTSVIEEFKTDTQFLIITHSKKTMMCAKSMYGVTMEDSGVSKLISVEFDEVGENGEILTRHSANAEAKAA